MLLRDELLREYSKAQVTRIAEWIGDDPDRFAQLMQLYFTNEYRLSQRASWVVSHCIDHHPSLIRPYITKLIANLKTPNLHPAVQRNTVRIFQEVDVPEEDQGTLVDLCFRFLADPQVAIAVRVFSMTVIWRIGQHEPDLMEELALTIEDHLEHGSAGFKSRGKKILRAIKQGK